MPQRDWQCTLDPRCWPGGSIPHICRAQRDRPSSYHDVTFMYVICTSDDSHIRYNACSPIVTSIRYIQRSEAKGVKNTQLEHYCPLARRQAREATITAAGTIAGSGRVPLLCSCSNMPDGGRQLGSKIRCVSEGMEHARRELEHKENEGSADNGHEELNPSAHQASYDGRWDKPIQARREMRQVSRSEGVGCGHKAQSAGQ